MIWGQRRDFWSETRKKGREPEEVVDNGATAVVRKASGGKKVLEDEG